MVCDQQDSYGNFCIYPAEIRVIVDEDIIFVCKECWERYHTDEEVYAEYIIKDL